MVNLYYQLEKASRSWWNQRWGEHSRYLAGPGGSVNGHLTDLWASKAAFAGYSHSLFWSCAEKLTCVILKMQWVNAVPGEQ